MAMPTSTTVTLEDVANLRQKYIDEPTNETVYEGTLIASCLTLGHGDVCVRTRSVRSHHRDFPTHLPMLNGPDYIIAVASLMCADNREHFWQHSTEFCVDALRYRVSSPCRVNLPALCLLPSYPTLMVHVVSLLLERLLIYAQDRANSVIDSAIDATVHKLDNALDCCTDCLLAYHGAKSYLVSSSHEPHVSF